MLFQDDKSKAKLAKRLIFSRVKKRRESLGLRYLELAEHLHERWEMTLDNIATNLISNKFEKGISFYAKGNSHREKDCERFSDYLAALNFTEQESKEIFKDLGNIIPGVSYVSSDVLPCILNGYIEKKKELDKGELVVALYGCNVKNGIVVSVPLSVSSYHENPGMTRVTPYYTFKRKKGELGGESPLLTQIPSRNKSRDISLYKTKRLFIGREEIVEKLYEWEGYEGHAKIVSRMEKPYVRE